MPLQNQQNPFLSDVPIVCPPDLLKKSKSSRVPVMTIAGAGSRSSVVTAMQSAEAGIARPLLIGDATRINAEAETIGWDLVNNQIAIEDTGNNESRAARSAVNACRQGRSQLLMKGQLHTDVLMKAVLHRSTGLRTGNRLVHMFLMTPPNGGRPFAISDAAVNVAPDIQTRKVATHTMVRMFHRIGNANPRIAFLSATETPISSVPSSLEARLLRDWARKEITGARFSGPLALDLILSPIAARIKGLQYDPVAGRADGVVVPDLLSGNTLFKALVHVAGACAAGVVNGARVPILLTSRADPPAARLASIALASLLAR